MSKPSSRIIREWERAVKKFSVRWDDEDEAFDAALDIVMSHNDAPMDKDLDYEEVDVELAREWAYQLLKHIGKPYGGKHWKKGFKEHPMNNDRKTLIRLASSLPKGSDERRILLAELQKAAKFDVGLLSGVLEMAFDNRYRLDNAQKAVWRRSGSIHTCPVCGSQNTELPHDGYTEDYGSGECKNCGSEWRWAADVEVKPEHVYGEEFWVGRAPLSQYPTKWSWLGREAKDWASYPKNVESVGGKLGMKASKDILEGLLQMAYTDEVGSDVARAWVANGNVYTCPVCGSNKTEVIDSLRTEKAKSECRNCGSAYWWAGEVDRKPNNVEDVSFGGRFGNGNRAPLKEQPKKGTFLYDEAKAATGG